MSDELELEALAEPHIPRGHFEATDLDNLFIRVWPYKADSSMSVIIE